MKSQFTILFILSFSVMFGQVSISVFGGVKLLKNENKTVIFGYVDESPSQDNIYTQVKQTGKTAIQLGARFADQNSEKSNHLFLEAQGYFGSMKGGSLNGGLFFDVTKNGITKIYPEVGLVVGYSTMYIGEMDNNDIYIYK